MRAFNHLGELLSSLPQEAANRIAGFLKREATGNMNEIETPLWDNASLEVVSTRWWDRIKHHPALQMQPLVQEEQEQYEGTAGFASIALPWDQVERDFLNPFFGPRVTELSIDTVVLRRARDKVIERLNGRREPLSLEEAQKRAPRNTSSGLPLWSTDPEILSEYLTRAERIRRSVDPSEFYPYVAGRRTTNSKKGETSKQRLLWIVDKAEVPLGKSVGDVVLEELRLQDTYAAWLGPKYVAEAVTRMLRVGKPIHSVDFSRYDASVENEFIQSAFEVLMTWVNAPYLEVVGEHFMYGSLVTPTAIVHDKLRGVPSGSSLTNMIDTIVQTILWEYVAIQLDRPIVNLMCQGDDGLVQFAEETTPDEIVPIMSDVGFQFNADKTEYHPERVKYLQDLYMLEVTDSSGMALPLRSSRRMINRVKRPERFPSDNSPALVSIASASKIDKCWGLPYFRELVQFYWEGDKLVRAKPLISLMREAGGAKSVKASLKYSSFPGSDRDPEELVRSSPINKELELIRRRTT